MKNYSVKNLLLDLLIVLEVFVAVILTTFLVFVFVLVNSITDALGNFISVVVNPFG